MSVLGLDSGYRVKYNPLLSGGPSSFALRNSFRQSVIFDRISLVSSSSGDSTHPTKAEGTPIREQKKDLYILGQLKHHKTEGNGWTLKMQHSLELHVKRHGCKQVREEGCLRWSNGRKTGRQEDRQEDRETGRQDGRQTLTLTGRKTGVSDREQRGSVQTSRERRQTSSGCRLHLQGELAGRTGGN